MTSLAEAPRLARVGTALAELGHFRLAKIPFEKTSSLAAFLKAPRKKLPYINDDGTVIADSETIIAHLKKKYDVWLDDWLTPEQRAISHTVRRMLEDGTYWVAVFERWMKPAVWSAYKPTVLSAIPKPMRDVAGIIIRRDYKRRCYGQGIRAIRVLKSNRYVTRTLKPLQQFLRRKSTFSATGRRQWMQLSLGSWETCTTPPLRLKRRRS